MSGMLTLKIDGKCNDQKSGCICIKNPDSLGLKVEKVTDIPNVTNFTKYSHSVPNGTFKLHNILNDGSGIGSGGKPIENVRKVSVYYWDGAPERPILLEIKKRGTDNRSNSTIRYGKNGTGGHLSWLTGQVSDLTNLKDMLDKQNCYNNDSVPFNIQDSQSGDILKNSKVECMRKSRKIERVVIPSSHNPPGSEYTVKSFRITDIDGEDKETKISRVTYKNQPTNIPPSDAIEKIRLYSYQGSRNVPLMIEFVGLHGGQSTFFDTKDGKYWEKVGNSNGFYDKEDPIPKVSISEYLDEVLCKHHGNVTLNLTKSHSEDHANNRSKYCCNEYGSGKERISVTSEKITVSGIMKTLYYKHSINGNLGGIKFYEYGEKNKRRCVKSNALRFPIYVNNVCVFYCSDHNPVLIYVDTVDISARGWYRKSKSGGYEKAWTWVSGTLKGIKPTEITDCNKWNILKTYITAVGCYDFGDCNDGVARSYPGNQHVTIEDSEKEDDPPKVEPGSERLNSNTANSLPSGSVGPSASVYAEPEDSEEASGAPAPSEVTINIYNRTTGGIYAYGDDSGSWITVNGAQTSGELDFTEYKHIVNGTTQSSFTVNKFQYGEREIAYGLAITEKVTTISAYYWTPIEAPTKMGKDRGRPLLIKVEKKDVDPVYYENISYSDNLSWKSTSFYGQKLEEKLKLLNCKLNNAVVIDINKKPGISGVSDYDACDGNRSLNPEHSNDNIRVNKDGTSTTNLVNYQVYTHRLQNPYGKPFHIVGFKNDIHVVNITGISSLPILDASSVKVYMCGSKPLLIYVGSNVIGQTENNWYKNVDGTIPGNWQREENTLSSGDTPTTYDAILDVLDDLTSKCQPPKVVFDISKRTSKKYPYYLDHDSPRKVMIEIKKITSTGKDPPLYYERYDHTVLNRWDSYFTLHKLICGDQGNPITGISTMQNVTSVSVYYWSHLPKEGRPLLLRIEQAKNKSNPTGASNVTWYENTGEGGDLKWKIWNRESKDLEKKLHLLNCLLNNAVTINLSHDLPKTKKDSWYCCRYHKEGTHKKIYFRDVQVSCRDHPESSPIKTYRQFLGLGSTLAGIEYYDGGATGTRKGLKLNGQTFPISGVNSISAFYCGESPAFIYVDSKGDTATGWYQKSNSRGNYNGDELWAEVFSVFLSITPGDLNTTTDHNKYNQLVNALNKISGCKYEPCPQETETNATKPVPTTLTETSSVSEESVPGATPSALQLSSASYNPGTPPRGPPGPGIPGHYPNPPQGTPGNPTNIIVSVITGYKGLLNHQFNRDDSDALITTAAFLSKNALNLFTGNISYMKIDLALSILPLETLNNKCFSIRNEDALPNILCAGGLLERNEWINAIESSMLCASTGVKSRLPLIPGEEILEEVEEDSPKGINLFIHDGPNGRPEIYINGKTTTQLEKEREELAMADSSVEPIADMSHLFHNVQAEDGPVTPAPLDQEAMDEAKVEAGLVSPNIPEKGYFHLHHHEI